MALNTRANFAAYLSPLSVVPGIGEEFAEQAAIIAAIGNFRLMNRGQLRINWTAGTSAQILGTDAGLSHTAAPGIIDESFTVDFAKLVAQAQTDIVAEEVGGASALADSYQMAVNGLYRGCLVGLVGAGSGANNAVLGSATIVGKTLPTALGMHVSGSNADTHTTYSAANLISTLDKVRIKLPMSGENIVLCNNAGYNAVKAAIRSVATGMPARELVLPNFDYPVLSYDGMMFFKTDAAIADITQGIGRGQASSKVGRFHFFNNGPEGVTIAFPSGVSTITQKGPIQSRTDAADVYNLYMSIQILPRRPYSVAKLTCYIS